MNEHYRDNEYYSPDTFPNSTVINPLGSFGIQVPPSSTVNVDGTMIAKEFKIAKEPTMFYQYEMRVFDLRPKETLTDDRCLTVIQDSVELPKSVNGLKEVLIMKHMKGLSEITTDTPLHLLTIDVKIVYQAQIKD